MKKLAFTLTMVMTLGSAVRLAAADSGIAGGPVLAQRSQLGVRGLLESGFVVMAGERYQLPAGTRWRAEIAARVALRFGRTLRIEPQLGIIPLDYLNDGAERRYRLSATATLRAALRLVGPLELVLEPVRAEAQLADARVPADMTTEQPDVDRTVRWTTTSWVALRVAF